jgi:hypothetical protein
MLVFKNMRCDQKVSDHIYFSFKQEGAWAREWGACDLGTPCACVNYCLPLGWLSHWQSAITYCRVCCVCRINDDQESWSAHVHQVLPETLDAHAQKPMILPSWICILIGSLQQFSGYCKASLFLFDCQHFWDKFCRYAFHVQILSEWSVPNQMKAPPCLRAL